MSEMQMEQNGPPQSFPPPKPQVPEAGSHAKQYSCPQATILIFFNHFNPISIPSSTGYFLDCAKEEFTLLSHLPLPIFLYEC